MTVKKVLAFAMAALFAVSASGCGKTSKTAKTDADSNKLTFWAVMDANSSRSLKSYSDMLLWQEMEKRMGVEIEFLHPISGSTGNEAFMTLLAGSDRPDIIEYNWVTYDGGAGKAIDDGVIIALDDYLEEYAPNYYDYMEGEKGKEKDYLYKLQSTTDDGRYYGFNQLSIGSTRCFSGLVVRGDLLEKWGMDIPETIDDWTAFFAKAKGEGYKYPFTSNDWALSFKINTNTFNTAFGVGKNFYPVDGKIVFAPFEDGFKEYVAQLSEWSKNGYIDPSFITNDWSKIEGNLANEFSVASMIYASDIGSIVDAAKKKNPEFELVGCPLPVAQRGDVSAIHDPSAEAYGTALAISAQCPNPEKAISFCDYIYSEEGNILHTFGIEGDTFEIVDVDGEKHYQYTDKIIDYEKSGVNNVSEAIYKYCLPANHPGLTQHPDYLNSYYPLDSQKQAISVWNEGMSVDAENSMPDRLAYTEDEAKERQDILEVAEAELDIALYEIILGNASVDTYDEAIKQAKKNGYDRVLEINQAAYDRYLSKLNK